MNSTSCGLKEIICNFFKTGSVVSPRRQGSWRRTTLERNTFKPAVGSIPEGYAFDPGSDDDLDSVSASKSPDILY